MDYDVRGLKTFMDDPDMGQWTYAYNVLGELTKQTDPKNQVVDLAYDTLGRLTQRVEPEGTTDWTYDTAAKGVGKLHSVSAPHIAYSLTQGYDSLGRPSATTTTIDGVAYTQSVTYDPSGRPETLSYPSGFAVRNTYNTRGYLASVAEDGGATVFWQADSVNAEGQVTQETFGNGVVTTNAFDPKTGLIDTISTDLAGTVIQDLAYDFDKIGNLKTRSDLRQDREEAFLYDGLNRLTTTTLVDTSAGGGTLATTTYTYDLLGNLLTKSDVGTYTYGGAGPHAVTAAGGETYAYDDNGNMTSGAGRTVAYASFNKPTLITETASGDQAGFTYGPDRTRIKQHVVENSLARDVVYVGSLYERRTQLGSPDELVHYVVAGTTVAIHTIYDDNLPATNKSRYLHRDHLGSVESITGETGAVVQRLSFDAHGKRRLADWTVGDPADPDAETPRGFTGHEHLDSVGLIHMNGRVYDPTLGRFLSADPILPDPTATQSFNRYSYVSNNPLSYTDPSGFYDRDKMGGYNDAFGRNPDNRNEPGCCGSGPGGGTTNGPERDGRPTVQEAFDRLRTIDPNLNQLAEQAEADGKPLSEREMLGAISDYTGQWASPDDYREEGTPATDPSPSTTTVQERDGADGLLVSARDPFQNSVPSTVNAGGALSSSLQDSPLILGFMAPGTLKGLAVVAGGLLLAASPPAAAVVALAVVAVLLSSDTPGGAERGDKNEDKVVLYRGVSEHHAKYREALLGIALPRDPIHGHRNPEDHNLGDTMSVFVSFTRSQSVAEAKALNYGAARGVVLRATVPRSRIVESPNKFDEDEVLVIGGVTNAETYMVFGK